MLGTILIIYGIVGLLYWGCKFIKRTPVILQWIITFAVFIAIIPIGPALSAYRQFKKGEKGWGWTMVVTSVVFYAVISLGIYLECFYKA